MLAGGGQAAVALRGEHLHRLRERAHAILSARMLSRASQLRELARALHAVSPLATLHRGYAIVFDRDGHHVVRSAAQAREIERFSVRFADGETPLRRDD